MRDSAHWHPVVFLILSAIVTMPLTAGQDLPLRPAVPVEPIGAILDAFRAHPVVALGEDHGNEQGHAFRLALIRDPRFAANVNDVVVEFGSARHQDLMDRFVRGDDVSDEALRHVWQDTTQISGVWDRPIYEDFYRAVRALNASLPRERQLRVLLADLPVDWDVARRTPPTPGERRLFGQPVKYSLEGSMNRDRHAADIVQREVLARYRRALVIFGDMHLTRRGGSIVDLLERDAESRVFTIQNATRRRFDSLLERQSDLPSWPVPSLALVSGTVLSLTELSSFDAVLYLGPPSAMTVSRLPPSLCSDPHYLSMRREHMVLSGLPTSKAEELLARTAPRSCRDKRADASLRWRAMEHSRLPGDVFRARAIGRAAPIDGRVQLPRDVRRGLAQSPPERRAHQYVDAGVRTGAYGCAPCRRGARSNAQVEG
jgi:Haem-binding uptake, Tiki superfamily, ChaN